MSTVIVPPGAPATFSCTSNVTVDCPFSDPGAGHPEGRTSLLVVGALQGDLPAAAPGDTAGQRKTGA